MNVYHNSQQMLYRSPFGAVDIGTEITLRIAVKEKRRAPSVTLRLWVNNAEELVPMKLSGKMDTTLFYEAKISAMKKPGLMWYYFIIESEADRWYYCNNSEFLGGEGSLLMSPADSYQITVYKKGYTVPKWLREGVMYQIFVDRFYCPGEIIKKDRNYYYHETWGETPRFDLTDEEGNYSNRDFFGGNLYGVIEKLPYLFDLGVTAIYLNPIFDAFSNHKYDTGDYENVDKMFGGNDAFSELCDKAKGYGIKIIIDGVFNHTGSDSRYFNKKDSYDSVGAYQSKESPYYSWYRFEEYPDKYDSWWGIDTLPAVNEDDQSYFNYMIADKDSIVRRWIKAGASGWRIDVADELPEFFIKALYKAVKEENEEAIVIGEVWEDASNKTSYGEIREYLLGEDMDSVMNYPQKKAVIAFIKEEITSDQLSRTIMSLAENYPKEVFFSLMNCLGTHDVPRILTVLGNAPDHKTTPRSEQSGYELSYKQRDLATRRLMLATLVQFTFPGFPSVYYGDEVGLEGMGDPFNRCCYPWGKEDEYIYEWYKRVIALRHNRTVLKNGCFKILASPKKIFSYIRHTNNNKDCFGAQASEEYIIVVVNSSSSSFISFTLNCSDFGIKRLDSIFSYFSVTEETGLFNLTLPPLGYYVLQGEKGLKDEKREDELEK